MYEIAGFDFNQLHYEYDDFLRRKRAMMDRIVDTLEGISKELVFHSKELSDTEREQLQEMQDKLEAVYDKLEDLISW